MTSTELLERLEKTTAALPFGNREEETADGRFISAGFGEHRDSDTLEQSNYYAAKATLEEALGEEAVREWSFGHWAVGWISELAVDRTAPGALEAVQKLLDRIESYPVLDEDDLFEREEEHGGRCSACGELGHHTSPDGGDCGQRYCTSIETYEPNDRRAAGGDVECYWCGEYRWDHAGADDDE